MGMRQSNTTMGIHYLDLEERRPEEALVWLAKSCEVSSTISVLDSARHQSVCNGNGAGNVAA